MNSELIQFMVTGSIGAIAAGKLLDLSNGHWLSSVDTHPNGNPRLYQGTVNAIVVNVGVDNQRVIQYIVVHTKDQDKEGGASYTRLDEILTYLNSKKIDWHFKKIFEKVLIVGIETTAVELIFSYYPDEEINLQTIQTSVKTGHA